MEEEYNEDIENEMDKLEDEIDEESEKVVTKSKPRKPLKEKETPTERYTAFYQEAKIGIIDTITKNVVVDGLSDLPTATLEALKLNKLDKIEIASGV